MVMNLLKSSVWTLQSGPKIKFFWVYKTSSCARFLTKLKFDLVKN